MLGVKRCHPPLCLPHRRRHHLVSDQPTTTATTRLPLFSSFSFFSHRHVELHPPFDPLAVPTNQDHDKLWPPAKIVVVNRRNPIADMWTANDGGCYHRCAATGEDLVAISFVVALLFRRRHSPSCYVATAASAADSFSDDTAITVFSHH
ncbi:unnamed protein product [Lactuca virosa]|uniref:Uncharacterized protein n=1 Tax=Lactuca virosa TaxID=75947 RepID=A0AAU9MIW1_9ASTR|nr:unnamed protein product [Lactuca virosa]